MAAMGEPEQARGWCEFALRALDDGSCAVRARTHGFEFDCVAPAFVEAQAMADRWREWVKRQ
jgi:hypothetical protein